MASTTWLNQASTLLLINSKSILYRISVMVRDISIQNRIQETFDIEILKGQQRNSSDAVAGCKFLTYRFVGFLIFDDLSLKLVVKTFWPLVKCKNSE